MRNLILSLFLLASFGAYADLTQGDKQMFQATGEVNLLANPGFENGITGWVKQTGFSVTKDVGEVLVGKSSAKFDPTASGQALSSQPSSYPAGLRSKACLVSFIYSTEEADGQYEVSVYYGTSLSGYTNLLLDSQGNKITLPSSKNRRFEGAFMCPDGTQNLYLSIESTGDAEPIFVDQAYLGSDSRVGNAATSTLYASAKQLSGTGCVYGQNTSSSATNWVDLNSGTSCSNAWTNTGPITNVPTSSAQTLPDMPKGTYKVTVTGTFATSISGTCNFRISDGTNHFGMTLSSGNVSNASTAPLVGLITYTDAGSRNFKIQSSDGHAGSCTLGEGVAGITQTTWTFERLGDNEAAQMRVDSVSWSVKAAINGASPGLTTGNVTPYQEITSGSLTLVNSSVPGTIPARIPCSGTNPATGTTCSVGDESVGVNFVVPSADAVRVCVNASRYLQFGVSGNTYSTFKVVETQNSSQVIKNDSQSVVYQGFGLGAAYAQATPILVCSDFPPEKGERTFRLFFQQNAAGVTANELSADTIEVTAVPIRAASAAFPYFPGLITSGSEAQTRFEYLLVTTTCTTSPCVIDAKSSDWFSSVIRTSAGNYTINLNSGAFNGKPSCTVSDVYATGAYKACSITAITPSLVAFGCIPPSGSAEDTRFSVHCSGPR